jgi:hypothetical protein
MTRKKTSCDILEIIKMKKLMTKKKTFKHNQNDTHSELICIKSYAHFLA